MIYGGETQPDRATTMSSSPLLPTTNAHTSRGIKVIFSNDLIQPLLLTNFPTTDIDYKWLRRNIRSLRSNDCHDKPLKFLKNGVYMNNSQFQNDIQRYLLQQQQDEEGEDVTGPYFIHCMIGIDSMSPDQLEEEDSKDDSLGGNTNRTNGDGSQQPMGAIGFDRLRGLGFSEEEINLLRQQFQSTYGSDDVRENTRELEERWMENDVRADGNDEQFNSIPIGNYKHNVDLLIGITIGFVLGIFSLILIRQEGLFNRRQLMAIYAGIMVNIVVCFTRL